MADSPANASDEEIMRELRAAAADLIYPSESDAPFDVFRWNATDQDALTQILAREPPDTAARENSVDDFFAELVSAENGSKFAQLRRIVESRLAGLRVLRIGEIEVDVYLFGQTPAGSWAGLHTLSVET